MGRAARGLLVALLMGWPAATALAWGEQGHRLVNAAAVENLPEPLRAYFRARKAYLIEHAIDPDLLARQDPEERPHHYTEADAYEPDAFRTFRKLFVDERRQPTALELRHGDSAWQIERFALRLEAALRRRRWDDADRAALFAAHYAADLTQPLHTLMNYDGQLTGQQGIHARFETDLVRVLESRWVFNPQLPSEEPDLRARIFREMFNSYSYRNPLFGADRIALDSRRYQDPEYARAFANLAGLLARRRLEAAISFVSSLWYTAWVRAGKPDLRRATAEGRREVLLRSPWLLSGSAAGFSPRRLLGAWRSPGGAETGRPGFADGGHGSRLECAAGLSSRAASREPFLGLAAEREGRLRGLS
jgi:hypothetical protein